MHLNVLFRIPHAIRTRRQDHGISQHALESHRKDPPEARNQQVRVWFEKAYKQEPFFVDHEARKKRLDALFT